MTTRPKTVGRAAALVVASVMLVAACADDGDDGAESIDSPTEVSGTGTATDTADAETTDPPATAATTSTADSAAPVTTEPVATTAPATTAPAEGGGLLDVEFQPVPPGDYRVETIGAPFTISIPDGWWVRPNSFGHFVLTDAESMGPGDRDIVMIRPSNLADPDRPNVPAEEQAGDWPLDDIEGWVEAVVPGVIAAGPEGTTLGGLDAITFDVMLTDDVACGQEACVGFATNRLVNSMWFDRRIGYRVWWIDGGDESPIAVFIGDGGEPDFTERAEAVLDTVVFESVDPNPIPAEGNLWELGIPSEVPAGTVTLPVGPGVTFELVEDTFIPQNSQFAAVFGQGSWETDIVFPSTARSGAAVETVDDVIAALDAEPDITVEVVGTREVDGREATVVDITGPAPSPDVTPAFPLDGSDVGWRPPWAGTLWIVQLDDGPAFVSAEWFDTGFADDARDWAEPILDSITFGP